jgi:hypothetical protein
VFLISASWFFLSLSEAEFFMIDPTQLHTYPPVCKTHNKNRRETVEEVIENSSISKCSIKGAEKPFSGA